MTDFRINETELLRFTQEVFVAAGVPKENAEIVADTLVQAEVHGLGSHGPSRLLPVYTQRFMSGGTNPHPDIKVVQQRGCGAVIDGDNGPGAVVGHRAMSLAIEMAKEHGSGWVATRNSNHFGAAFVFARQALSHGMVGFTTTSAVPQMAPLGGTRKMLGTNPICIAVPGGERGNIILDMATTVVARGKIQLYALQGKPIPEGWAVDAEGNPTTDPQAAAAGRMLPVGGPKGYGLSLMVEIFSAMLSGAAFGPGIGGLFSNLDKGQGMGHFFGALDVSIFRPLADFRAAIDGFIDDLKSGPRAEGVEEILVPGEPEARKAAQYRQEGIPIASDVIAVLNKTGEELGVSPLMPRA